MSQIGKACQRSQWQAASFFGRMRRSIVCFFAWNAIVSFNTIPCFTRRFAVQNIVCPSTEERHPAVLCRRRYAPFFEQSLCDSFEFIGSLLFDRLQEISTNKGADHVRQEFHFQHEWCSRAHTWWRRRSGLVRLTIGIHRFGSRFVRACDIILEQHFHTKPPKERHVGRVLQPLKLEKCRIVVNVNDAVQASLSWLSFQVATIIAIRSVTLALLFCIVSFAIVFLHPRVGYGPAL
mmetsp:Transcript_28673/g.67354  ORF Transcript_28673/g.67354 Transcript_28673/m.67354 type:complete len:235 (+) Transcript_28673:2405-3109(+)